MDFRALGALATGYLQGQLANRDRGQQFEQQAYQRQQEALAQALRERAASLNDDTARAQKEYQQGVLAGQSASLAAQVAENGQRRQDAAASAKAETDAASLANLLQTVRQTGRVETAGTPAIPAYDMNKTEGKQLGMLSAALQQPGRSMAQPDASAAPAMIPNRFPVDYAAQSDTAGMSPLQAALLASKKQGAADPRAMTQNVGFRQDTPGTPGVPYSQLTPQQLAVEQYQAQAGLRPGTELTYDKTGATTIGVRQPSAGENADTAAKAESISLAKELRPSIVKGGRADAETKFYDSMAAEVKASVAKATQPDQIEMERQRVLQAMEEIQGMQARRELTVVQAKAATQSMGIALREIDLREKSLAADIENNAVAAGQRQQGLGYEAARVDIARKAQSLNERELAYRKQQDKQPRVTKTRDAGQAKSVTTAQRVSAIKDAGTMVSKLSEQRDLWLKAKAAGVAGVAPPSLNDIATASWVVYEHGQSGALSPAKYAEMDKMLRDLYGAVQDAEQMPTTPAPR